MTAIAYFEVRLVPGPPSGELPKATITIPARRGHEVEQMDALIAGTDPDVFTVAPHTADGTVCGIGEAGVAS